MGNVWDKPEGGDYSTYQQAKESYEQNQTAIRESHALSGVYSQTPQPDYYGTKDSK